MFYAYAHGESFTLECDVVAVKHLVYVACRMSSSEYHGVGAPFSVCGFRAFYAVVFNDEFLNAFAKVNLAAAVKYGVSYILDYQRQFVASDVRMRFV